MKKYLGIEIGGTKIQVVSGSDAGKIDHRFYFPVNKAAGAAGIRASIEKAIQHWGNERISGIGIGFGGPVDRVAGSVWTSYHIGGWSGFGLTEWLTGLTGAPVVIENDANTAALGEALYGAGKTDQVVFYTTLGSGVGGGLVIDQKIYHGVSPGENEFGHVRLDKSGRTVESSCSGWSINEKIRKAAAQQRDGILASLIGEAPGAEAKILLQAIRQQDAVALTIFNETVDDLAFGLSHIVHLFHPDTIVLGGGFSNAGEPLRKAVEQRLAPYLMDAFQPGPAIRLSALREDAVPVGALLLAHQQNN